MSTLQRRSTSGRSSGNKTNNTNKNLPPTNSGYNYFPEEQFASENQIQVDDDEEIQPGDEDAALAYNIDDLASDEEKLLSSIMTYEKQKQFEKEKDEQLLRELENIFPPHEIKYSWQYFIYNIKIRWWWWPIMILFFLLGLYIQYGTYGGGKSVLYEYQFWIWSDCIMGKGWLMYPFGFLILLVVERPIRGYSDYDLARRGYDIFSVAGYAELQEYRVRSGVCGCCSCRPVGSLSTGPKWMSNANRTVVNPAIEVDSFGSGGLDDYNNEDPDELQGLMIGSKRFSSTNRYSGAHPKENTAYHTGEGATNAIRRLETLRTKEFIVPDSAMFPNSRNVNPGTSSHYTEPKSALSKGTTAKTTTSGNGKNLGLFGSAMSTSSGSSRQNCCCPSKMCPNKKRCCLDECFCPDEDGVPPCLCFGEANKHVNKQDILARDRCGCCKVCCSVCGVRDFLIYLPKNIFFCYVLILVVVTILGPIIGLLWVTRMPDRSSTLLQLFDETPIGQKYQEQNIVLADGRTFPREYFEVTTVQKPGTDGRFDVIQKVTMKDFSQAGAAGAEDPTAVPDKYEPLTLPNNQTVMVPRKLRRDDEPWDTTAHPMYHKYTIDYLRFVHRVNNWVPRKVFLYWQGGWPTNVTMVGNLTQPAWIIEACAQNFERLNPDGWKINRVDGKWMEAQNFPLYETDTTEDPNNPGPTVADEVAVDYWPPENPQFVGFNKRSVASAHRADRIRLALVKKYGGLYTDATLILSDPFEKLIGNVAPVDLDSALEDYFLKKVASHNEQVAKKDPAAQQGFSANLIAQTTNNRTDFDDNNFSEELIGTSRSAMLYQPDQSMRLYLPYTVLQDNWFLASPPENLYFSMWNSELWVAWLQYKGELTDREQFEKYKARLEQYNCDANYFGAAAYQSGGRPDADLEMYLTAYKSSQFVSQMNGVRNNYDDYFFQFYYKKDQRIKHRYNWVTVIDPDSTGRYILVGREFFFSFMTGLIEFFGPMFVLIRWPDILGYAYFEYSWYYSRLVHLTKLTRGPRDYVLQNIADIKTGGSLWQDLVFPLSQDKGYRAWLKEVRDRGYVNPPPGDSAAQAAPANTPPVTNVDDVSQEDKYKMRLNFVAHIQDYILHNSPAPELHESSCCDDEGEGTESGRVCGMFRNCV
ncbi:unnamed protein product [Amoebophrya sp. A120]|nr:unnamed protein product [Amoebophrya sp. A120]|eukprot:GSA120T00015957001.1